MTMETTMTKGEFKAWFEGFSEGIDGVPTKEQWDRVCSRVKEIDGKEITYPVFIDRYLPSYPYRPYNPIWYSVYGSANSNGTSALQGKFTSVMAMKEIGKLDAMGVIDG